MPASGLCTDPASIGLSGVHHYRGQSDHEMSAHIPKGKSSPRPAAVHTGNLFLTTAQKPNAILTLTIRHRFPTLGWAFRLRR